jgi:hypothetical protein
MFWKEHYAKVICSEPKQKKCDYLAEMGGYIPPSENEGYFAESKSIVWMKFELYSFDCPSCN